MSPTKEIRILGDNELVNTISALAKILLDCVHDGASLGFMLNLDLAGAEDYWRKVMNRASNGELAVLGAFVNNELAGTVTLIYSAPPNQVHKADIAKLLVSPKFRRMHLATELMDAVEDLALEFDRNLLVLDTLSGTPAESFYVERGWTKAGEIPRFALLPEGGEPLPTSLFYKDLRPEEK